MNTSYLDDRDSLEWKDEAPPVCPKGHPLWYPWDNIHGKWGICGGGRWCNHVWYWGSKRVLRPCPGFNPEVMVAELRKFGHLHGYFEDMRTGPADPAD
jgi:hypothetical protein